MKGTHKALFPACLLAVACGGGGTSEQATASTPAQAAAVSRDMALEHDDQSRCDYKGRVDREVIESSGPGAVMPNVRRVFGIIGEGDDRRRVLFCREIDTNLDGAKDVVRTYNDKGDPIDEQADTNYDGKIDTWIHFSAGHISKVEIDTNHDGAPDETRYYVKGKISRIQRDTNFDGKPDVWEIYTDGELERIGVDLDFDGHVDRWDRDEVAHRIAEEKERQEEEKAAAKGSAVPTETSTPPAAATKAAPAPTPSGAMPPTKAADKPNTENKSQPGSKLP